MKIVSLAIKQFMGIEEMAIQVPSAGAVFVGKNGSGKTSVLKAITSALTGNGIDPSAIRNGASKAEILLDLGDFTVRRAITQAGGTIKVTHPGDRTQGKPQTFLNELLGGSPLDPLALFHAKDKERRDLILKAIPVSVTPAQLMGWVPGLTLDEIGQTVRHATKADEPIPGHGLEVVARFRDAYYAQRTRANAKVEERERGAATAKAAVDEATKQLGDAPVTSEEEAARVLSDLKAEARRLHDQEKAANEFDQRAAQTRRKIADMRRRAEEKRVCARVAPAQEDIEAIAEECDAIKRDRQGAQADVERLAEELRRAEKRVASIDALFAEAVARQRALDEQGRGARTDAADANDLLTAADDIEAALGEPPAHIALEEAAVLEGAILRAEDAVFTARQGAKLAELSGALTVRERELEEARASAGALDAIVKRLANEVPSELLAATSSIPGLSVKADDILLDGVSITRLCGAEQIRFAVRIAKRLSRSKLLVVDGLEALCGEHLDAFLSEAASDGFQIIATRAVDCPSVMQPLGEAVAAE